VGAPVRLGIMNGDDGLRRALVGRLASLGWPHRTMGPRVPIDALRAMRLDALVIAVAGLGPYGWPYLGDLCAQIPDLGVVVYTVQSSVRQRVRGLKLGVDDWITEPVHPDELLARVEAVVRRRRRAGERQAAPIVSGEIEIDADGFQAFAGGRPLDLTRREFELLHLLATGEGRVLEREQIYERVWGYAMVRGDRSVDAYVRKLRQKLERASPAWTYIHTHFGIGYRFAPHPVAVSRPDGPAAPAPEPVR
jgi:DNA-binding response OmpR family regulator